MPSASLDSDDKYTRLLQLYQDLYANKFKSASHRVESTSKDTNNNNNNKSNCKLFDNILESLIWLTEQQDKNLLAQLTSQDNLDRLVNTSESHSSRINVLITGSLYLVGLSLKVLNFKTA